MASDTLPMAQDSLLRVWSRKAFLQRLFLPQDFMENVSPTGEETLVCHKTTNDYLAMNDHAEKKTVKTGEAKRYSTNVSYRPKEFKNETLKIFADTKKVTCDKCRGNRRVSCPTKQKCSGCGGSGRREKTMSGTHTSSTPDRVVTSGSGRFESTTTVRGSSSSRSYEYKVKVICDKCSGRGEVTCSRCGGSGRVVCDRCSGAGVLVSGNLITRRFAHSQEMEYQLTGLEKNEFKNGLSGKHFRSVEGDLLSSEYETPSDPETVLQRKNVHSYSVLSRQYSYKNAQFHLNEITSTNNMKHVATGLPFSKMRVAVASILSSGVAAGAITILAYLA